MGLSSIWTAIKRQRSSETESRKHVDRIYTHHQTASPVIENVEDPLHHFDAIYDTHHHILPSQSKGPKRNPSSPPRIHSPTNKQPKKPSLWKTTSLSVKPSPASEAHVAEKTMKRRSFWRSEPKPTSVAPPVRAPEVISSSVEDRKSKRSSFWRSDPEELRLVDTADSTVTDTKAKRSSRRLSLRRTLSGKSSGKNSLRFSFLANGHDDTDDEDIPAMPPIPTNLQRQKSRSRDPGRDLGFGDVSIVQPGTAVTSDDLYNTASPQKSRNSLKRQSLSKLMTSRKSTGDLQQDQSSNKRKRRSWFSVHNSGSTLPDSAAPPMPALPSNIHPSEAAFHRFLQNAHNLAPKGASTDFERFMDASRAFDASLPAPQHLSRKESITVHAPRPLSSAAPTALPALSRSARATSRSRASHCRPRSEHSKSPEAPSGPFLSNEQQREWNKLRELMDNSDGTQPSTDSSEDGDDDDDGVMGMLRELKRDEEIENFVRFEKASRERQRRLGAFDNKDALERLEFGMAR